jgi:tetratricopeptide (TPR) repeat protein
MSPEQIEGRAVDRRSDIFAVGLVAYELLTYKKAYSGTAPHAVLDKILHSEPQPLLEVRPELDPRLATVIERAIQKSPDERYDTLGDLALELSRIREHLIAQDATVRVDRPATSEESSRRPTGRESRNPAAPTPQIPNFEAIAQRRSARIAEHFAKARDYYEAQDYRAAIDQCEQAAVLDPSDSRVLDMLHRAHRALEDGQVALWLNEAQALVTQGLLSDAERLIDESLQLRPNSSEALALQQQIRVRRREQERAAERERAALSAVSRARTNLEEGALEAAIRCATEALAHDPGRQDALELRALAQNALLERERLEEHEQLAHEVVAAAREKAATEDVEDALRSLRAFAPAHPVVDEAIAELEAEALALERRRKEAEAARQRQREVEEARRRDEERLARERDEARRREEEAEQLRLAAEQRVRVEQAATAKEEARAALRNSQFADALAALDRVRAAAADDDEIDLLMAGIVQARQEAEVAEQRQRTADELAANALECIDRGDAEAAQRLVDAALEAAPAHSAALQLKERARTLLEDQRRAEEQQREANAAAGTARRLFVTGDYPGAVRLLEKFSPRALVDPVLEELHTEWRRQEQRRAEAAEASRRREDERARAALEAKERADAEARAVAERAERERAEAAARAAAEAEAVERRRAEAERAAREADARRQAKEAEAERARNEAAARTKERAERAAAKARGDDERRQQQAEEKRLAKAAAVARRAAETRAAEPSREDARRAVEAQQRSEPVQPEMASESESRALPAKTHPRLRFDRRIGIGAVAAVIAIAVIGGAWWMHSRRSAPGDEPRQSSAPTRDSSPKPPPVAASTLQSARSRYGAGDLAGAAALVSSSAPPDQATMDLISQIRTAAEGAAASARTRAGDAGASGNPAYQNGGRKETEAAALTQPSDIAKVVGLYKEAKTEYLSAISAAAESSQLIRSAADALRRGDIPKALTEAGMILGRDPGAKPALEMLAAIRGRAQKEASSARTDAVRQGGDSTAPFREAEGAREVAERNIDPRQTRQQVAAFERARDLYLAAAAEVTSRRADAQRSMGAARAALERGDLQAAERALNDAVARQPDVDGAASLRVAIEAARPKPAPAPKTNVPPAPAPSGTAPTRPAAPSASAAAAARERAAIIETLQAYAGAHARLDAGEVVRLAPYLAGPSARQLANAFRDLKTFSMQIASGEPAISGDGTSASVRCTITRSMVTKNTGAIPSRTDTTDVSLQKKDGRWVITNVQNVGGR